MKCVRLPLLRSRAEFAAIVALLIGVLTHAGCQDEPRGGPRVITVPITGKVLVDGKPQAQVQVQAQPVSGSTPTHTTPSAFTDAEGNFAIQTYEAGDGAPAGEYKLTFRWGQISLMSGRYEGDKLKGKYANPARSEHSVSVSESDEPINLGTIKLTTK
jgi:hypothetical protein